MDEHDIRQTTRELLFHIGSRGIGRVYPAGTRIEVTPYAENGRHTVMLLDERLGEQTASLAEPDLEDFTESSD